MSAQEASPMGTLLKSETTSKLRRMSWVPARRAHNLDEIHSVLNVVWKIPHVSFKQTGQML
jgi:hypothetical protein